MWMLELDGRVSAYRAVLVSAWEAALDEAVLRRGVAVLGICVGMQILGCSSEEGTLPGLRWIDADVRKFDVSASRHAAWVPHMGWNDVRALKPNGLFGKKIVKKV